MSDTTDNTPENTNPAISANPSTRKTAVLGAVSATLFGTSLAAASFLGARTGVAAALKNVTKAVAPVLPEAVEVAKGFLK